MPNPNPIVRPCPLALQPKAKTKRATNHKQKTPNKERKTVAHAAHSLYHDTIKARSLRARLKHAARYGM
jgi:hypothetical protein